MLNVRIMAGNSDEANAVRKSMVKTMWDDCIARMSKIKGISGSDKKDYLLEMHEEFLVNTKVKIFIKFIFLTIFYFSTFFFKAGLLIYDLGIGSDDRELANSIWRRFFMAEDPPDFRKIELLVQYVRENTSNLEKASLNDIIFYQKVNWRPLRQSIL